MTSIVTKVEVTQQKELDAWQSSMSACLTVPLATCDLHPAIPISSVDKANKIWLPWQRSLRDFKNNFTLIIHSLGSTNPENLTKISLVDFEIIFWSQRTHTHICKSAPCFRQITTPAPHHSVFTDGCPSCSQPTASKGGIWSHRNC